MVSKKAMGDDAEYQLRYGLFCRLMIYFIKKPPDGKGNIMSEVRLQKFMADAGVASRRKCEELIAQGRVEVDGRIVLTQGAKISGNEVIKVDGSVITAGKRKIYILLNKPAGYISTARDQFSRKTVMDLVGRVNERIYPVGRLDYDTSGLIILTNDGGFANMITHPGYEIKKVYRAVIMGKLSRDEIDALQRGMEIEDYTTAPCKVHIVNIAKKDSIVDISIHEGRNRQVRKMFEALNHPVLNLKRIAIGAIGIGGLEEGKWRYLSSSEVKSFRRARRAY